MFWAAGVVLARTAVEPIGEGDSQHNAGHCSSVACLGHQEAEELQAHRFVEHRKYMMSTHDALLNRDAAPDTRAPRAHRQLRTLRLDERRDRR